GDQEWQNWRNAPRRGLSIADDRFLERLRRLGRQSHLRIERRGQRRQRRAATSQRGQPWLPRGAFPPNQCSQYRRRQENRLKSFPMLLSEKQCQDICDKLLNWTKADDAEVSVGSDDFSHLRFAANSFTTDGRRESASASITVWIDKKRGSASSGDLEDASLKAAVAQAEDLARISPVDKEYLPTLG